MQPTVYTVKQFNDLVNTVLKKTIGEVSITGEISGYKQGKWIFFDIKDGDSVLNCFAMPNQMDIPLEDGQEVIVTGTPGIYVPFGKYSFTVRSVQLKGEGALKKAFEDMRRKLEQEGLFSPMHKRPLPRFPERVGIITSGEGAAINDIMKVMKGRWGGMKVYLIPVAVQGKNAPDELVNALNYFNQYHPVDVIIFGRGGGSLEDLQSFNSERVARAIFSSRIPIVSGIGHEHNTSIADLVADVRAATPSNAAEIAIPDRLAVGRNVDLLKHRLSQSVEQKISSARHEVKDKNHTLQLMIGSRFQKVRLIIHSLYDKVHLKVQRIRHHEEQLSLMQEKLNLAMRNNLRHREQQLGEMQKLLQVLNPTAILERGYSITYDAATGKPITRLAEVPSSGRIKTQVSDGTFDTHVGLPAGAAQIDQARLF